MEEIKDWSSFTPPRSPHQEAGETTGEFIFNLEEKAKTEVMTEDQYDTATVNDFAIKTRVDINPVLSFHP